jgi:hypothetical protein
VADLSRREFIAGVAAAGVVAGMHRSVGALAIPSPATSFDPVKLRWLEQVKQKRPMVTGTVPWPKGVLSAAASLSVTDDKGAAVPSEFLPLAYWPDGSVKWTLHSIASEAAAAGEYYQVVNGPAVPPPHAVVVRETAERVEIDTGVITASIAKKGSNLIDKIVRQGRASLLNARLICQSQNRPEGGDLTVFLSRVDEVSVESSGSISTVIKLRGSHFNPEGQSALAFTVRLYFSAGSDEIKVIHTFVYDCDEQKTFVRGIGVRFDVAMSDQLHDRHIRFGGSENGLFIEAVRGITGLRRDPGEEVRKAQIEGRPTPAVDQWQWASSDRLNLVPAWGDYTLSQLCADGFQIRKRTREGFGWIAAAAGTRSSGSGYVGGVSGGVAFGIRDFWQKHPARIDIREAHTDSSQVTLWLWSPDAPAMDLRFYHDGMGQDTYPKQAEGLDTTYEDYEPGYASPFGIARTSELKLRVVAATPSSADLTAFTEQVSKPAMLVCEPQRYLDAGVFGASWTLPDKSTETKSLIEDQLSFYLDQYIKEIDQRSWYGFWDYGDVRHTYDQDRHVWRYDIGGFAWDNSELSTDLWLWYSFLRTGRADVFRMAEAMTRHTGEVDVYHIGPRKGLGTRHGVQHWGDSSKQTRISSALFRRPYYFLTGDHRVGDLLKAQLSEGETWLTNDVQRKLGHGAMKPGTREAAHWGSMAWGELASAWLTEIERTQNTRLRDTLLASMQSIAKLPLGFFTQDATMNLDTGVVTPAGKVAEYEHLTAVFGLPEICLELVRTYGDAVPQFADTWAKYGELYNGSRAERKAALGIDKKSAGLVDAHSRCTAFAAWHRKDPTLAARAWNEWLGDDTAASRKQSITTLHLRGPEVLNPIDEASMSTNGCSQFSLATIQNLALVGHQLPEMK